MDRAATTRVVLALAERQDFVMAGIAPATPSPHADYARRWIAAGKHGEMGYLAEHLEVRLDPGRMVAGARAVIVVADRYPAQVPVTESSDEPLGKIARYAWGDDYHKVIKKRLHALADALSERFPGETFRAAVDTAPVMEREHAVAAGLGWVGKHTLMIHPRHGSWFLLGVIITTLDCATSGELRGSAATPSWESSGGCGTCTRCIDACPTDAIAAEGYQLDATRCISYLTLEHRSLIPDDLLPGAGVGQWIAGCDICQEVCPYNRDRGSGTGDQGERKGGGAVPIHPRYTPRNVSLSLLDVLGWSAEDRVTHFRGSALKRMKLPMVKRNALIAAANALREAEHPALRARIEQIAADDDEESLVRDTARQVLRLVYPQ